MRKGWQLIVADADAQMAAAKIGSHSSAKAVGLNVANAEARKLHINAADIVISMLPPALHIEVAKTCLALGKHLLTASYVDEALRQLAPAIESKELLFLCEMGLDPGIDHMSALQLIHRIQREGGKITAFRSHCGGLIAPESDDNPWHYKISWNPRNIVLAGKAGAVYKENGQIIERGHAQVFAHAPALALPGLPVLEWYPNRDSLSYMSLYGLEDAATFIRTTLRYRHFCSGWRTLIELGLTDTHDGGLIADCQTYAEWLQEKIHQKENRPLSLRMYVELYVPENEQTTTLEQLRYLGLDTDHPLPRGVQCSADILQHLLEKHLALQPNDRDMIVMLHEINYTAKNGQRHAHQSLLVTKGDDNKHTAMAKTVGLPLAIAATLILEDKIKMRGLHIPIHPAIYEPVLAELALHGIRFEEYTAADVLTTAE